MTALVVEPASASGQRATAGPTLALVLMFAASLTSSPSILRGWTPDVLAKILPIVALALLLLRGRAAIPRGFIVAWTVCFAAMLLSGLYLSATATAATPALNSPIILLFLLALMAQPEDGALAQRALHWWRLLFWLIAAGSIVNWVTAPVLPSLFREIDFGELYEGNARAYLASPLGVIVVQDYGLFSLYRVAGILAEPGMMSMFFLANAAMTLVSARGARLRAFGIVNLLAGFTTHSVAFYFTLSLLAVIWVGMRGGLRTRIAMAVLLALVLAAVAELLVPLAQGLVDRSSFDVRGSDTDFLLDLVSRTPLAALVGFSWWGEYRQLPAAFPQVFYQAGLIGLAAYWAVLGHFLRGTGMTAAVVLIYGFSIDYQTFMIFPLLLFVIRAHSAAARLPGVTGGGRRAAGEPG